MPRLILATGNQGKVVEMATLVGPDVEVLSIKDLALPSPAETGETFEENAIIKARAAASASGIVAVADDSGIEVDALGGAPGVRSARFAGENASDADNTALLLERLQGLPQDKRAARFICVISVATPDGEVESFRATLEGWVREEPRGTGGFGYDPVLTLPDGRTVAELSPDEKNAVSHRGKAMEKALPYIRFVLHQHV